MEANKDPAQKCPGGPQGQGPRGPTRVWPARAQGGHKGPACKGPGRPTRAQPTKAQDAHKGPAHIGPGVPQCI